MPPRNKGQLRMLQIEHDRATYKARLEALLKRAYLRLKPTSRAFDAKRWAKRIARRIVKLR
jgi:hypothetical protein